MIVNRKLTVLVVAGEDQLVTLHGRIFRIEEVRMEPFRYDATVVNYFLLIALKSASFLLFGIPWLVLRFSGIFTMKR